MNLTSKRILKGLAVCAGACALSATAATTWVADSFEDGAVDQAINTYKAEAYGGGLNYTNYLWESQEGDASKLVATTDQAGYTLTRPITNVTDDLHLQLETEGTTLVRYLSLAPVVDPPIEGEKEPVAVPFDTANGVYIDTMIKFTPSEDDPEINDANVKVAVFVNANSNLVVYHTIYDADYDNGVKGNSVFNDISIDPDAWYRLTIQMGTDLNEPCFQVFLNQTALTHQNAWTTGFQQNGTWFVSAAGTDTYVTQVSFQGTGAIDEFVVADEADLGGGGAIMLTLTWAEADNALLAVTQGGSPVARNAQIESGSEIVIAVTNWYELVSVAGTDIVYGGTVGSQIQASTGTVTAAASERTATVTVQQLTGDVTTGLGGAYATVDGALLSAWALDNNLSQEDVGINAEAYLDDFLLDVPPGTDATIAISSIEVSGTTATITVTADKPAVDLGAINGTLKVVQSDSLPVTGTPTYIAFTTDAGVATIVIPTA